MRAKQANEVKDGVSVYVKTATGLWELYAVCETPADAVDAARYLREAKGLETVTR
jgi:hypothetical protein